MAKSKHKYASSNLLLKNRIVDIDSLNSMLCNGRVEIRWYFLNEFGAAVVIFHFLFFYSASKKTPERNWVPSKKDTIFIHKIVQGFFSTLFHLIRGNLFTNLLIFFISNFGFSLKCLNWVVNDAMVYFSLHLFWECFQKLLRFTLHNVVAVVWFNLLYICIHFALGHSIVLH